MNVEAVAVFLSVVVLGAGLWVIALRLWGNAPKDWDWHGINIVIPDEIETGELPAPGGLPAVALASPLRQCETDIADLENVIREAETLLTNYLVAGRFPRGSDCEEVRDMLRRALCPDEDEWTYGEMYDLYNPFGGLA